METKDIIDIIKAHLAKAEEDLAKTPRGSNHGRVAELQSLLADIARKAL